jgi:hypothetical protein
VNFTIRLFGRELLAVSTDPAEEFAEAEGPAMHGPTSSVDFGFAPSTAEDFGYWEDSGRLFTEEGRRAREEGRA